MPNCELEIRECRADAADFADVLRQLQTPPQDDDVQNCVAKILSRVQKGGDAALLEITAELDKVHAKSIADLRISPSQMHAAVEVIPPALRRALQDMAERVRRYHERQKPQDWEMEDENGNQMGERFLPVSRAAVYAPGGRAAYPSSVLMGVIPAKVAGVESIIVITPPQAEGEDGKPLPVVLAAAAIAGADEMLCLGGAQAAAAAAFGTASIPRADVFVGPGNMYQTEAKRQLAGRIGLDSPAGPSEVLILADESANPTWVAADMLAQAEHDPQAQSILVTDSAQFAAAVRGALAVQLADAPRAEIIRRSLATRGALIVAADMAACCEVANHIAAEHVQIFCAAAAQVAAQIRNVGGLFIGAYSCTAFGDYGAGPNHVLPTNRAARFASPLGVQNFLKRSGWLAASAAGAAALSTGVCLLAESELLPAHAHSAALRGNFKGN